MGNGKQASFSPQSDEIRRGDAKRLSVCIGLKAEPRSFLEGRDGQVKTPRRSEGPGADRVGGGEAPTPSPALNSAYRHRPVGRLCFLSQLLLFMRYDQVLTSTWPS